MALKRHRDKYHGGLGCRKAGRKHSKTSYYGENGARYIGLGTFQANITKKIRGLEKEKEVLTKVNKYLRERQPTGLEF